jgi:hypothetical protein
MVGDRITDIIGVRFEANWSQTLDFGNWERTWIANLVSGIVLRVLLSAFVAFVVFGGGKLKASVKDRNAAMQSMTGLAAR